MEADLDEMIENPNEGVTRLIKDCVQWEDNIKRKNGCEYMEVIWQYCKSFLLNSLSLIGK